MSVTSDLSPAVLEAAATLVRRRTGLVFSDARRASFASACAALMHRADVRDATRYLKRLEMEDALLDDLVADITVGESYFYREPQQFALIRDEIIPGLNARQRTDAGLRLWSAGCAGGEEPYTLAIILRELGLTTSAHLVATDLSRASLTRARRASYSPWSLRGVSDDVVQTYFTRANDRFHLASAIRDAVEFSYLNLAEDSYPSLATGIWGMDLILCRNVLIYFDNETIAHVARRLMDSLSEDGWLLLGASDPALASRVACDVVTTDAGLAYRRRRRSAVHATIAPASLRALAAPPVSRAPTPVRPTPPPAPPPTPVASTQRIQPPHRSEDQASADATEASRCYATGDYASAAELARQSVQRDDGDPVPWIVLVRALANRGELSAAGLACAAALDRHRTSAELLYLHAVLLAEAGQHAAAADAARRALYLDRGLAVAYLALGTALARLGEMTAARRAFRNAERLLASMAPDALVPASDGEPAARLAEMARVQARLLSTAVA